MRLKVVNKERLHLETKRLSIKKTDCTLRLKVVNKEERLHLETKRLSIKKTDCTLRLKVVNKEVRLQ